MRRTGSSLTQGEREVIILLGRGLSNQEIAELLNMSTSAVRALLYQVYTKLRARNRIESVLAALRRRIISVDEVFSLDELVEMLASLRLELVEAIAQQMKRKSMQRYLPPDSEQSLQAEKRQANMLTNRERDVLALVARGLTNQEIADQLYTSISTVRTFLYQASIKLAVNNRSQAVISAVKLGAVNIEEAFSPDELAELLTPLGPDTMETIAQLIRERPTQECSDFDNK